MRQAATGGSNPGLLSSLQTRFRVTEQSRGQSGLIPWDSRLSQNQISA